MSFHVKCTSTLSSRDGVLPFSSLTHLFRRKSLDVKCNQICQHFKVVFHALLYNCRIQYRHLVQHGKPHHCSTVSLNQVYIQIWKILFHTPRKTIVSSHFAPFCIKMDTLSKNQRICCAVSGFCKRPLKCFIGKLHIFQFLVLFSTCFFFYQIFARIFFMQLSIYIYFLIAATYLLCCVDCDRSRKKQGI